MSDNFNSPSSDRVARERSKSRSAASRDIEWITFPQAEKLAETCAEERLAQFCRDLGIDIRDIKELRNFREDLTYLRVSREANVDRKASFSKSLITSVIGTAIGLVVSLIGWLLTIRH